jgi:hypothetical protein
MVVPVQVGDPRLCSDRWWEVGGRSAKPSSAIFCRGHQFRLPTTPILCWLTEEPSTGKHNCENCINCNGWPQKFSREAPACAQICEINRCEQVIGQQGQWRCSFTAFRSPSRPAGPSQGQQSVSSNPGRAPGRAAIDRTRGPSQGQRSESSNPGRAPGRAAIDRTPIGAKQIVYAITHISQLHTAEMWLFAIGYGLPAAIGLGWLCWKVPVAAPSKPALAKRDRAKINRERFICFASPNSAPFLPASPSLGRR